MAGTIRIPLPESTITSRHGYRTLRGKRHFHEGMDFGVRIGTPIRAVADGWVCRSKGPGGSFGHLIVLYHGKDDSGSRYYSIYAHLNKRFKNKGQTAAEDALIANSGNTGASTGPHLHYEVRVVPKDGPKSYHASFWHKKYTVDPLTHEWPTLTLPKSMRPRKAPRGLKMVAH